jgi:hypothetical protein
VWRGRSEAAMAAAAAAQFVATNTLDAAVRTAAGSDISSNLYFSRAALQIVQGLLSSSYGSSSTVHCNKHSGCAGGSSCWCLPQL